jgi:hypothetical protein
MTTKATPSTQVNAQVKATPGQWQAVDQCCTHFLPTVAQRLQAVQIDVNLDDEDESLPDNFNEDGEDNDNHLLGVDSEGMPISSDDERVSDKEEVDISNLDACAVRAAFEKEVCFIDRTSTSTDI